MLSLSSSVLIITKQIVFSRSNCICELISNKAFKLQVKRMTNGFGCTRKLNNTEFQRLFTPEFKVLMNLFSKNGHELRIAGGAVRDLLTGKLPHDIDFATTATPQEMVEMFERENVRLINNNGEKHGTVTCRINDKENFEVTTLRVDLRTDGRHAEVEFTKDWIKDAERRDLTVNSMFLGCDGTLYDYFGGMNDLECKRLRFVGTASKRIQEDYLRILRYFRFFGRISQQADSHETETLMAIKENAAGLSGIAGERIWTELKKITTGNHVGSIFKVMADTEVLSHIGFTGNLSFDNLSNVWERCHDLQPLPMTIITALFSDMDQVEALHGRVKMSKDEFQLGQFILDHRHNELFVNYASKVRDSRLPSHEKVPSDACGESQECKKLKLDFVETDQWGERKQNLQLEGEQKGLLFDTDDAKMMILHHCQDIVIDSPQNIFKTKQKLLEMLKYLNLRNVYKEFEQWAPPKFPVSGIRLLEIGIPKGPTLSRALSKLRDIWKESHFEKTEEELLQHFKQYKAEKENKN